MISETLKFIYPANGNAGPVKVVFHAACLLGIESTIKKYWKKQKSYAKNISCSVILTVIISHTIMIGYCF